MPRPSEVVFWTLTTAIMGIIIAYLVVIEPVMAFFFAAMGLAVTAEKISKYRAQAEIFNMVMTVLTIAVIASALYELSGPLSAIGITIPSGLRALAAYGAQMRLPVAIWAFLMYYYRGGRGANWYAYVGTLALGMHILSGTVAYASFMLLVGVAVLGSATILLWRSGVSIAFISLALKVGTAITGVMWALSRLPAIFPSLPLLSQLQTISSLVQMGASAPLVCGVFHLLTYYLLGERGHDVIALTAFTIYGLMTYSATAFSMLWSLILGSIALWLLLHFMG